MSIVQTLRWWLTFLFATYALSKVFEASRLLTQGAPEASIWPLLGWGSLLVISFLILGYDSYRKAKAEGKVVHPIGLFEKIHQFQVQEKSR